jgi:lantibiotic modifying enzyme
MGSGFCASESLVASPWKKLTARMPTWRPKIVANAERARSVALEIAHRLQVAHLREVEKTRDMSLAGGEAGLAVLFGYLDRCFPNDGWDKVAHQAVLRIGQNMNLFSARPIGLFGGLSGLAYAIWYLSHEETRYRRARQAVEDVLLPTAIGSADSLARQIGMGVEAFDLISGLTGVAAYLLCRSKDERAHDALRNILEALVNIAEHDEPVPAWFTPAALITSKGMVGKYPEGNLNCGLAHGVPGLLSILALSWRHNVRVPGMRSAIERLAGWLKVQRVPDQWGGSWPAAVAVGTPLPPAAAPVGWCYGSPGVAQALWLAGIVLNDSSLIETAMEALNSVYRRPLMKRSASSPTFCHGLAGVLHITMRFSSETQAPQFADAANRFLEHLLRSFLESSAFGYCAYDADAGLVDRAGLLDGAAGVALVLLAAASDHEPGWDRVFLLS